MKNYLCFPVMCPAFKSDFNQNMNVSGNSMNLPNTKFFDHPFSAF